MVLFDVTNRNSFQSVSEWVNTVRDRADEHVKIGILGHKVDLKHRAVSREEAESLASQLGAFYM